RGRAAPDRPRHRPGGRRRHLLRRHEPPGRRVDRPRRRGRPGGRAAQRLPARAPGPGGREGGLRACRGPALDGEGRGGGRPLRGPGGGLGRSGSRARLERGSHPEGTEPSPPPPAPAEERLGAAVASGLFTLLGGGAGYLLSIALLEPRGLLSGPNNLLYLTVVGALSSY